MITLYMVLSLLSHGGPYRVTTRLTLDVVRGAPDAVVDMQFAEYLVAFRLVMYRWGKCFEQYTAQSSLQPDGASFNPFAIERNFPRPVGICTGREKNQLEIEWILRNPLELERAPAQSVKIWTEHWRR